MSMIDSLLDRTDVSVSEFLAYDEENEYIYYELIDGRVYMQNRGKSYNHGVVLGNLFMSIRTHIGETSDYHVLMNFKVCHSQNFYQVDLILDGNPNVVDIYFVREPKLLIQGLGETSTREFKIKFAHYRNIPTLEEYAYFHPDIMRIDIFRRSDDWEGTRYEQGDDVEFKSIGLTVPIAQIYEDVIFIDPIPTTAQFS